MDKLITFLYSNELIRRIMTNQSITIFEFNVVINFLVFNNIPFDVSFDGATRKMAPAVELTIHINPTRTEVLVIAFNHGANPFLESP